MYLKLKLCTGTVVLICLKCLEAVPWSFVIERFRLSTTVESVMTAPRP